MAGDDRQRHCTRCDQSVHDLSAMSEADARALLAGPEERMCVRFRVRSDGTVVTGGRFGWLGSAGGALGIAVAAVVFWTGVTLLQRPWRALAHKLAASTSPVPLYFQPSADDQERRRAYDELMKQIADSRAAMMAAYGSQTVTGTADRASVGFDFGRLLAPPKHARKPRR